MALGTWLEGNRLDRGLKIFLLTRVLQVGGAERQLVLLAECLRARGHAVAVGVFYAGGPLHAELEAAGIEIVDFAKKGRWDVLPFLWRVVRELRRRRPQVVYGFLGSGNLVASAASRFVPGTAVVWSVRASNMDLANYDWLARLWYNFECRMSGSADAIIANSSAGAQFAVRNGFPASKVRVIRNGIDTGRFRPNSTLRAAQRQAFDLADDEIAIGVLARLDPMKGHETFLEAARQLATTGPKLRFFCIGEGPERARLEKRARDLGLGDRVAFTGEQDPVAALNALDIACSCSLFGEGFSNAVAEAMACGLPCVVTDVGDSAAIVGDLGAVVPVSDPAALATALTSQIENLPRHDPDKPRTRIIDYFSVAAMVDATLEALRAAATQAGDA